MDDPWAHFMVKAETQLKAPVQCMSAVKPCSRVEIWNYPFGFENIINNDFGARK